MIVSEFPKPHYFDDEKADANDWRLKAAIDTLEGPHFVTPGDWIITGIQGERYPCKPDIFAATYDPVEEATDDTA